MMYFSI